MEKMKKFQLRACYSYIPQSLLSYSYPINIPYRSGVQVFPANPNIKRSDSDTRSHLTQPVFKTKSRKRHQFHQSGNKKNSSVRADAYSKSTQRLVSNVSKKQALIPALPS